MTSLSIVPIAATDLPFVRAMLYEAAFWRSADDRPPLDAALSQPGLALYVHDWGREGDDGLIVWVGGRPVGAVWVRWFDDDVHGYGYVDRSTPELSIAVALGHRGRGLGRCLLSAMLAQLRLQGIRQVSLSAEIDNPARRLYESLGFTQLPAAGDAGTMVRTLS